LTYLKYSKYISSLQVLIDLVDPRFYRYAALKILVACVTETSTELKLLQHLAGAGPMAANHVVQLLDQFKHTSGPNGTHICLVFELMGPSVSDMVEEASGFKYHQDYDKLQYPVWIVRKMARQVLQALEFLHQNGIAHGDLQPENLLFTLKNLEHIDVSKIRQDKNYKFGSISPPVERLDGKVDKWSPRYLAVPQPLYELADIGSRLKVKLSDLGGG
jgi:serine/threonine protein kinase